MISGDGKNVLYYSLKIDRRNVAQIRQLIAQLDAIIDELFNSALESVRVGKVAEYYLDTGQNKTQVKYRTMGEVTSSIEQFEGLRQMYLNQIENQTMGRVTQLVDQSNFRNRR